MLKAWLREVFLASLSISRVENLRLRPVYFDSYNGLVEFPLKLEI
jgi:hypothetical protein